MRTLAGLAITFLLLSAPGHAAEKDVTLCADFNLFSPQTSFATDFTLAAFDFKNKGSTDWFIYDRGSEKGLQFTTLGSTIKMPASVKSVTLRVGTFSGATVTASATKGAGDPATHDFETDGFTDYEFEDEANKITEITLTGGEEEGILGKICTLLTVAE